MPALHTYHCNCSNLLLGSTLSFSALPRRAPPALDRAIILPTTLQDSNGSTTSGTVKLLATTRDRRPVVVSREDGFEKRWVHRCVRCRVAVGYNLGEGGEVLYLLEGGLTSTEEMEGKTGFPQVEV